MAVDHAAVASTPSHDVAMAGLDALDGVARGTHDRLSRRLWRTTWPKLVALGLILLVWQIAYFDPAQHAIVAFYYWLKAFPVPLSAVVLGVALLYGIIRYASSSYTLNTDGDLIINTGILGIGTRMGPFVEFQLTIPTAVIGEVDISRNPIQFLFRTGTLSVTYRELDIDQHGHKGSEVIILPFILKSEKARDALMASSQVHNARFIV